MTVQLEKAGRVKETKEAGEVGSSILCKQLMMATLAVRIGELL